jgi:hypothetical protein
LDTILDPTLALEAFLLLVESLSLLLAITTSSSFSP